MRTNRYFLSSIGAALLVTAATSGTASAATRYASVIAVSSSEVCTTFLGRTLCSADRDYEVTVNELSTTPGSSGALATQTIPLLASSPSTPASTVHAADIDGDGLTDLVIWYTTGVYVLWGQVSVNGGAFFGAPVELANLTGTTTNTIGDVDGDGAQDLVAWSPTEIRVAYGSKSRAAFSAPTTVSTATFYGSAANLVEDLNGDGKADFIAWSPGSISVSYSEGYFAAAPFVAESGSNAIVGTVNIASPLQYKYDGTLYSAPALLVWSEDGPQADAYEASSKAFEGFGGTWVNVASGRNVVPEPFFGSSGNFPLDVNQDGALDYVGVTGGDVWVEIQNVGYTSVGLPTSWLTTGVAGTIATLGGYTER